MIAICCSLSVTCYLSLANCYLLSDSFYLQHAKTCINLFLSLVVVRLVIFFSDASPKNKLVLSCAKLSSSWGSTNIAICQWSKSAVGLEMH